MLALAEKDTVIDGLRKEVLDCKKTIEMSKRQKEHFKRPHMFMTSSVSKSRPVRATSRSNRQVVLSARDTLVSTVSGIPKFTDEGVTVNNDEIGKGQFGTVKTALLHKLGITVVAKIMDENFPKKAVFAEAIVGLTLSGHNNFPFCFGLLGNNIILMEYFRAPQNNLMETCPTFSQRLRAGIKANELKFICSGIIDGIAHMHSKHLLHNDIKSDNVIVADAVKIIDFGKTTLISRPLVYNVVPGSEEHKKYNSVHRHLAHELRNIPGSSQTIATDTYSVGHMFKHAAATINFEPIIQLGRAMKHVSPISRLSLASAVEMIKLM